MKKIILLVGVLWMLPFIASAHTTVSNSTPTEGQVITDQLTEVKVEFAGEIEKQSTLILMKNDQDISFDSISVNDKEIIGTVTTPLSNGHYVLTWKIAAKDGHAMTGDIPFSVQIAESEETEPEAEEETENNITEETPEIGTEQEEEGTIEEPQYENGETSSNEDSNTPAFSTISVIILIVLLSGGIWVIFRKKR